MIKIEKVVLASPEQLEAIVRGVRNPLNSWDKSDSGIVIDGPFDGKTFELGDADHALLSGLAKGGPVEAKYRRMMPVWVDITAPLYWWKEFDTYKIGTVSNSCSTMHCIHTKEFEPDDFSEEDLIDIWEIPMERREDEAPIIDFELGIDHEKYVIGPKHVGEDNRRLLERLRVLFNTYTERIRFDKTLSQAEIEHITRQRKRVWRNIIQLLPTSYNQKRTIYMNYEVLTDIYHSRKNHKLQEWRDFCKWIESLPYSDLITKKSNISVRAVERIIERIDGIIIDQNIDRGPVWDIRDMLKKLVEN